LAVGLASCAEAEITYGYYVYQSGEIVYEFQIEAADVPAVGGGSGMEYTSAQILEIAKTIFGAYGYETDVEGNILYAWRYFESRTDYNIFYGVTGDEAPDEYDENFYKEGGVFFEEYVYKMRTQFADIEEIVAQCANSGLFGTDGLTSPEEIAFIENVRLDILAFDYTLFSYVYIYGTYYDSIDSNADEKIFDAETGLNEHIFYLDYDTKGRVVELRQRVPNLFVWVLSAAGVSVFVALAGLGVAAALKKK
jgi:hypothetical protein